jgi:putative glutamine amidotransferase
MNWLVTASSHASAARYADWLREGGVRSTPVIPGERLVGADGADALLLSGGGDVAPWRYGDAPHPRCANINEDRDQTEIDLTRAFILAGKPIFGICRGIQIINIVLGGGLIQHVPDWLERSGSMEQHTAVARGDSFHALSADTDTDLARAMQGVDRVNSAHHQAIDPARLAPGLRVACTSGDGIIEAAESSSPAALISAVQWHPERLPPRHQASHALLRLWAGIAMNGGQEVQDHRSN